MKKNIFEALNIKGIDSVLLLSYLCFVTWLVLFYFQMKEPSLLRGILQWIPLIHAIVFDIIYRKKII